ncbi:PP2C family protein-serine/threonine phosphatase [Streptomyces sp. TRM 70361]|uniref:PP2C family protein-serine/threonine phosphatase n=1 Tax=Streptomyces sp. TRM 70361 TaxID=3116553 RepID=UPI002E7C2ADE|nr:PP2C family protein-serine/threonine phosphatase [Streptomyces sp. TRM 70361]MEE1940209.1 PP2C family protein-serine/threonine phosphatase [Streptomyces sp. TRM 70361]
MLAGLLSASHLLPLELLPDAVAEYAAPAGLTDIRIYLTDLQQYVLRLLPPGRREAGAGAADGDAELRIEGTVPGRAFQHGRTLPAAGAGPEGYRWWVPVLDGTEHLGVMHIATTGDDERVHDDMNQLATLTALLLTSKSGHSDSHARLVRTRPMGVAAEMQWQLMPPLTYADGRVVIGAALEPAYEISGDAFDYATAGPVVHLAVFDAMGHDTAAGLTVNLAVAACRNHRRQGAGPAETGEAVERTLVEQFGHSRYVTGVLAELDTRTGEFTWINRGHHPPVVIRGGRWSTLLRCPPTHPLGTGLGLRTTVCREQLEPGDRVVFYTDGITEARGPGNREFGLSRFIDFIVRHHSDGLPVPETLRRLVHSVLDYHGGRLQDDATVLLCQWLGPAAEDFAPAAERAGLRD